jgi:hypothetical protein
MFSLQQVRSTYYPLVDVERQGKVERVGTRVLDGWPVPLKGYRYRFQVVDGDEVSAVFGSDSASSLIQGRIESVDMKLRNVDRWVRAGSGAAR